MTAGVSADLGPFTIHAVWAKPPGGDPAAGIEPPDVQHLGYVIDAGAVGLYLSGDPNNFADHEELLAPIRDLEPHVGLLTSHPTEGEFPFFEGCARTAAALGLRTAVPAHYGCFVARAYDPARVGQPPARRRRAARHPLQPELPLHPLTSPRQGLSEPMARHPDDEV